MCPLDPTLMSQIPETLTYEDSGRQVKYSDHPFIKDAADFGSFAKAALDNHREVGARIPINVKDDAAREEWRKTHLPKLYEKNLLTRPPALEEYEIKKPEKIPAGFGWSDDLSTKFRTTLHKHGISKAAVGDLLALHEETMIEASKTLQVNEEKVWSTLKAEHGDKFDERLEAAKRLTGLVIKTPEELAFFDKSNFGNSPTFLSVLMRLAPLAMQDSSFATAMAQPANAGGGSMTHEDVKAEISKIMNDKDHPMYKGYKMGDPKVQAHIDGLYNKAFPNAGKVEIS